MFVHKVNGGERWSIRKLTFLTYYSTIMEKIIKNDLNYIQSICLIRKDYFCIPTNHANGGFLSWFLTFVHKSIEEKGDRQEVGSCLRFIGKLRTKLLWNQLNYKQKLFIIKKIVVFIPWKLHKWRNFQLISQWSPIIFMTKSGENSSVCVVSGEKKLFLNYTKCSVFNLITIIRKTSIFWPTTFLIHCTQTCTFVDKMFSKNHFPQFLARVIAIRLT